MSTTIESTNGKIIEKIKQTQAILATLGGVYASLHEAAQSTLVNEGATAGRAAVGRKKAAEAMRLIDTVHMNIMLDEIVTLENEYNLSVIEVLSDYYARPARGDGAMVELYYRIVTGENFIVKVNDIIAKIKSATHILFSAIATGFLVKAVAKGLEYRLDDIVKRLDMAHCMHIDVHLETYNHEICRCGARMDVLPELSELHCPNPICGEIRTIVGAVFRDEQFYPQEGQKTKHGGYDTSRHYRFWIERIQGAENKTFEQDQLDRIEYVLNRDKYNRGILSCEDIRTVLKDSSVNLTTLNNHATLLVKLFGGPAPPKLSFQENRLIAIRFNKAMRLYDIVVPNGGNKPYYPYFIYKIIEHEFKGDPHKLRLLDFIHLQSRETVIKNDKLYEQMCDLADDEDGLIYCPTIPGGK
jgi:hypothetical protein